ncbi:MAG: zf-HC2 domain-containing protein [Gloeomargarita sp. SKYG116]|nr:zf-HC2 domain-containing protein [Gloeomargarita sp. SKYG116]MDW8401638.1 zf-HC2 domain-containing protein [Gloeomargarita sp. SKYGB_i_bin116]
MPITRPESPDRFELLSAYLDGEASPEERALVEHWLATDPELQRLYRQLVNLHELCQGLPAPSLGMSADEVVTGVLTRITRRARKRLIWSGILVATSALVGGIISGLVGRAPAPELAQQPTPPATTATLRDPQRVLRITLEQPPVVIPAQLREQAAD